MKSTNLLRNLNETDRVRTDSEFITGYHRCTFFHGPFSLRGEEAVKDNLTNNIERIRDYSQKKLGT